MGQSKAIGHGSTGQYSLPPEALDKPRAEGADSGLPALGNDRVDWRRRRPLFGRARYLVFGGAAILVVLAIALLAIHQLRQDVVETTERYLTALSAILAEQTARTMHGADLVLESMERSVNSIAASSGIDSPALHAFLLQRIDELPQARYATVIGSDGKLLASSFSYPVRDVWLGDRHYVTAHAQPGSRIKAVEAVRSRTTDEWLIMFSRRWDTANGSTVGVLNLALDRTYFADVYKQLAVSPSLIIRLVRSDGAALARYPDPPGLRGANVGMDLLDQLSQRPPHRMVERLSASTGTARFYAGRAIPGYPLAIALSVDKADVLAVWYVQTGFILLGALMACGAIAFLLWQSYRVSAEAGEILDATFDALAVVDAGGRIARVNPALERMFSFSAGEVVGRPLDLLLPVEEGAQVEAGPAIIAKPDEPFRRYEAVPRRSGRRRSGATFPVEVRWGPVRLEGADCAVATIADVTDRNRAEAELNAAVAEAREARGMFASVIDASPFPMAAFNREREIIVWNRAAEAAMGLSASQVVGRPYPFASEAGRRVVDNILDRALAGERVEDVPFDRRSRQGAAVNLLLSGGPIRDVDDRILGVIIIAQDVTASRAMQEQLHQSQKMEAIGQLTGGIAHDFNNMLMVIIGNAEMLLHDERDPKLRSMGELILRGAEGAADLTARLLAFARRQPLQPARTDIKPFVERMAGLMRRTLGENVEIVLDLAPETWPAIVDPSQLEAAILNLAINARDAMPNGGRLRIVSANTSFDAAYAAAHREAMAGDFVSVALEDAGTGMSAEVLQRAFEPFFTTKDVGKGTGLGLSMVYGFVKQSGGWVSIDSEVGRGTVVSMHLPRAREAKADAAATPDGSAPVIGGSESILVVEDEKLVREFVETQLTALGYAVSVAETGDEARRILSGDRKFDLLLTDVLMPGATSGPVLADYAHRLDPGLGILFTTAYARDAAMLASMASIGAPVLNKPYRLSQLAAKVREVLDRRGR